jgi:dimethylaniline monooxygenase (N-oxide forming)
MHAEIQRVHDWLADVFPARPHGYFVGPHLAHHIDDLLGDIAVPTRRTSNIVAEYLGRFTPSRYSDVAEQRRLAPTNPQALRVSNTIASVIRSKR